MPVPERIGISLDFLIDMISYLRELMSIWSGVMCCSKVEKNQNQKLAGVVVAVAISET